MDKETKLGKSRIQHGKDSDRVYLIKLDKSDFPDILEKLDSLAKENSYTKIFAKVPDYAKNEFLNSGYLLEASVPGKFHFMGKYLSDERGKWGNKDLIDDVLRKAQSPAEPISDLVGDFKFRQLGKGDMEDMINLYKKVFDSYPFPIFKKDFLQACMDDNTYYYGVFDGDNLVAISAFDAYPEDSSAEMTDTATLKDYRGRGISQFLLAKMDSAAEEKGLKILYTICRAVSYGINRVFFKAGYTYAGTLPNNTQISGNIESMNVWYKLL
jgi:lysine 2,3-aminomutase